MTLKLSKLQAKWVKALKSDRYEQATGVLKGDSNEYCCLGVACEVIFNDEDYGRGKWVTLDDDNPRLETTYIWEDVNGHNAEILSPFVVNVFNLNDDSGDLSVPVFVLTDGSILTHTEMIAGENLPVNETGYTTLTDLNDSGHTSLVSIGTFIEKHPEVVFGT